MRIVGAGLVVALLSGSALAQPVVHSLDAVEARQGVASDGSQIPVPVFTCPSIPGARCAPAAIPLPPAGDPTYVSFFGTGFRGANPVNVVCLINGVRVPVEYAGPQSAPGLDQINVRLLPEVRGQPPLSFGIVTIMIDGVPANAARLQFR